MAQSAPPASLDDLVSAALDQHRPELERIIRERIFTLATEIVAVELNGHANGANGGGAAAAVLPEQPIATRLCRLCQERPAATGRTVCEPCRKQERSARKREPETEADRPDAA